MRIPVPVFRFLLQPSRLSLCLAAALFPASVLAQRVGENAAQTADDAFGTSIGNERVGLYSSSDIRGFSPIVAGNVRLDGLYFDRPAGYTDRMVQNSVIRVGLTAQDFLFPAPTGIVEYALRPSGDEPVLSTLFGYGTLGGGRFEIDGQAPLVDGRLSIAAGIAAYQDEYPSGSDALLVSYGLVPRWRPNDGVEVIPFWGRIDTWDREATPLYVAADGVLPAPVERRRHPGPDWADTRGIASNYGVVGKFQLGGPWRASAGVFRSTNATSESHAIVYGDVRDGTGQARISADPAQRTASDSGEARVTRQWNARPSFGHALHLSVRGRERSAEYGGSRSLLLARSPLDAAITIESPDFEFGPRTRDRVHQHSVGLGYDLRHAQRASLSIGAQAVDYRKRVERPGIETVETQDSPLLYNAAGSWRISPTFALYASHTRGLEESGVAPDFAANRNQALPAILTRQSDAGARWVLPGGMRLVAGVFEVEKPYFSTNEANVFTEMGLVRHSGVELSLAGTLAPRLTVVAGAVLMDPEVSGAPVDEGRIGPRPVGQTRRLLTLSGQYTLASMPALALTFNANHHGGRVADRLNRVTTPASTILDAGVRYRFALAGKPALLRFQMTNVTDEFDWKIAGSSTYEVNAPRSFTLFLTVDH